MPTELSRADRRRELMISFLAAARRSGVMHDEPEDADTRLTHAAEFDGLLGTLVKRPDDAVWLIATLTSLFAPLADEEGMFPKLSESDDASVPDMARDLLGSVLRVAKDSDSFSELTVWLSGLLSGASIMHNGETLVPKILLSTLLALFIASDHDSKLTDHVLSVIGVDATSEAETLLNAGTSNPSGSPAA